MNDCFGIKLEGFVKITDPTTNEVLVDRKNSIHYENFSEALAYSVANKGEAYMYVMAFGNGGTSVDPTGVITYSPPNSVGSTAKLYNQTYQKIIDDTSANNVDRARNRMEIRHTPGAIYTDVFITCLLDYGEPAGQAAFDNSQNLESTYVFDELGIRGYDKSTNTYNKLLTHVIFHPVQKSANRLIQVDYTIRISSLTNLSNIG
jgi:hypothetical protein